MTGTGRGRVTVEPCAKRVRAIFGGEVVVDTVHPLLVWEGPHYPQYYVPLADVRTDLLVASDTTTHSPSRGDARHHTLKAGGRESIDAAWEYPDSPIEELRDHLRFEFGALDHWLEEDEEIIVHPRNPYHRVDILPSSRHVQVAIDGVTVAETHKPTILFETGLKTRFYLPLTDVRLDLLEPSDSRTGCPYKGWASYYSVRVGDTLHEDVIWHYPTPLLESILIAGLVCFYNERVELTVDGVTL
jgi:uncharacterized protein (DUF427 family)